MRKKFLKKQLVIKINLHVHLVVLTLLVFQKKKYQSNPINIPQEKIKKLLDNMVLYFTGLQRHAQEIERNKIENLKQNEDFLKEIYSNAIQAKKILYSKKKSFYLK